MRRLLAVAALGLLGIVTGAAGAGAGARGGGRAAAPPPESPVRLSVVPSAAGDEVVLDASIAARVPVENVTVRVTSGAGVRVAGTDAPRGAALEPGSDRSFTVRLAAAGRAEATAPVTVSVEASLAGGSQHAGDSAQVWLRAAGGALRTAGVPAAESPVLGQAVDAGDEPAPHDRAATYAAILVYGGFDYCDHPVTEAGVAADSTPVDQNDCDLVRPIRRAKVQVQRLVGSTWKAVKPTSDRYTEYTGGNPRDDADCSFSGPTDCDGPPGSYDQTFKPSSFKEGDQVRAVVCTIGPYGNGNGNGKYDLFKVIDPAGKSPYCLASAATTVGTISPVGYTLVHLGRARTLDSDANAGPWNVYDTLIESHEYLQFWGLEPTGKLQISWSTSYNPTCGSCYQKGNIDLNGVGTGAAQWDDSVIHHEVGHWVMDEYLGGIRPASGGSHGACQEGFSTPNLEFSEGWATFYMAAARSSSLYSEISSRANKYLDASGGIGTASLAFNYDLDTINGSSGAGFVDTQSNPAGGGATNRGNFCEWQVAATLWDVIDGTNDGSDALTEPYADVHNAAMAKMAGGPVRDVNALWYAWTNTGGTRSAGSFGAEQEMVDNFAGHAVDLGVILETRWNTPPSPNDLDGHLWLPKGKPYHLHGDATSASGLGSLTAFPYAQLMGDDQDGTDGGTEQIRVLSPYAGSYTFAAYDFVNPNITGATDLQVFEWDASLPTVHAFSANGFNVPSTGKGDWWSVLSIDIVKGTGKVANKIGTKYPGPYSDPSSAPGAPVKASAKGRGEG